MNCTKKRFTDKSEAIVWHQIRYDMSFRVYKCPHCGFWHITTSGISEKTLSEMAEIIQDGKAIFIKKISNKKSLFLVEHYIGTFIVTYRKGRVSLIREVYD